MNFVWAKSEVANMSATLYETNITLNKAACSPFEDVRHVLLGHDAKTCQLAIKPVTKEEYELDLFPKNQLHKISIGKSYGRISNKIFMKMIAEEFELDYQNGIKYDAIYDEDNRILIIQL